MAKTVQFKGGTTTQHSTFTGANREITIDTDKHVPVVHDGVTPGGYPLAKASGVGGVFTSNDGKSITVVNGIIVSII